MAIDFYDQDSYARDSARGQVPITFTFSEEAQPKATMLLGPNVKAEFEQKYGRVENGQVMEPNGHERPVSRVSHSVQA